MVRTSVTVTLNSASIAARIWGFVASRCTRRVYSLRAAYAAEDFSVTTGLTIVSCSSGIEHLRRLVRSGERGQLDHHRVGPEDLVGRRVREPHDVHAGDVAAREGHVVGVRLTRGQEQHLAVGDSELGEQLDQRLRLRLPG